MAEHENESLHIVVATLRADHKNLDRRVQTVEREVGGLRSDLTAKHAENQHDIHDLRDSQQTILDLLHRLDLKFARFTGYAIGAGAVITFFLKVLDRVWK